MAKKNNNGQKENSKNKPNNFRETIKFTQQTAVQKTGEHPQEESEFKKEDLEYINIAATHPMGSVANLSKGNGGRKFTNLEDYEKFLKLQKTYDEVSAKVQKSTSLSGRELEILTIKEMLENENLSNADKAVLKSKLPKEKDVER